MRHLFDNLRPAMMTRASRVADLSIDAAGPRPVMARVTPLPPHFSRHERQIRGVLLDLDGTLIDHFNTLYACYRHALSTLGLPVPSREVVRRSVGGSMEVTMHKLVDDADVEEAAKLWREHLARIYLDDVTLMPGGGELVRTLHARGVRLAVFTNKTGNASRGICAHLGVTPYLDLVLGANDTAWRKPQPEFSALALQRLGTAAAETVMIGDSPYDIEAARAGGMACLCVTTGTHNAEELAAAGADAIYPDLWALGSAVFGIDPPDSR